MHFLEFETGDGKMKVEVSEELADVGPARVGRSKTSLAKGFDQMEQVPSELAEALKKAIAPNAAAIAAACRESALRPDKVEVTFGLKAGIEGGIAFFGVAKATAEANYTVKMAWSTAEEK
jgi:hypothetical protein